MVTLYSFNWIDYVYFLVIVLSMTLGAWRGFARSLLACIIWILAFILPGILGQLLAPYFSKMIDGSNAQLFFAMGSIFIVTLVIGFILGWIIKKSIQDSEFSGADRFMGAIFGIFRGIALLAVVTALISLTNLAQTPTWQKSVLVQSFDTAIVNILSVFPASWTQTVDQKILST